MMMMIMIMIKMTMLMMIVIKMIEMMLIMDNHSYALNNAYYHFAGRLANEARALRTPLMERDQQLIVNGFIKQSHEDYLLLRDQCMTEAQKAAAAKKKKGRKKGKKGKKKGNCRRCRGVLDAIDYYRLIFFSADIYRLVPMEW